MKRSGHSFRRASCAANMIQIAPLAKKLIEAEETGLLEISMIGDHEHVLPFAIAHVGHDCIVEDEYGRSQVGSEWVPHNLEIGINEED